MTIMTKPSLCLLPTVQNGEERFLQRLITGISSASLPYATADIAAASRVRIFAAVSGQYRVSTAGVGSDVFSTIAFRGFITVGVASA